LGLGQGKNQASLAVQNLEGKTTTRTTITITAVTTRTTIKLRRDEATEMTISWRPVASWGN